MRFSSLLHFDFTYFDGAADCQRIGDEGFYAPVAFDAIVKGNHE